MQAHPGAQHLLVCTLQHTHEHLHTMCLLLELQSPHVQKRFFFKGWIAVNQQWTIQEGNHKNNPTYNCIQRKKIPGNKLNQGTKDPYTENYNMLLKEIKDLSLNKWKTSCSWISLTLLKCQHYPKRSTIIAVPQNSSPFCRTGDAKPQIHVELQGAP